MRRLAGSAVALVLVAVLLVDGTATAQEDPNAGPTAESSPEPTPEDGVIFAVTGETANHTGVVRLLVDRDQNNTFETKIDEFAPYTNPVSGGVRVALGDFDGDGNDELVTATGGNAPIRVFDLTSDGHHGAQLAQYPTLPGRGAQLATGDINNDGRDELVIGADHGSSQVVIRTGTNSGLPDFVADTFAAYPQNKGVRVSLGNTDNNGGVELVTAQGPGVVGRVKIWHDSDADNAVSDNPVADTFLPYNTTFKGGITVRAAQNDGNPTSAASILVAPESGKKPVRRFADTDNDALFSDNLPALEHFLPYGANYSGGIRLTSGDLDRTGFFEELAVSPKTANAKPVLTIDDNGTSPNRYSAGTLLQSFAPYSGLHGQVFTNLGRVVQDTYSATGLPRFIGDSATTVVELRVPASAGIIRDLNVFLNIAHTFDGDLDVTLRHADTNTTVALFNDVGGSDAGFFIRLDDGTGADIATADNPDDEAISGTFNPQGAAALSVFNGQDASGLWQLSITDDSANDTGSLFGWELQISV